MERHEWLDAIWKWDERIRKVVCAPKTVEAIAEYDAMAPDQFMVSARIWSDRFNEALWCWMVVSEEVADSTAFAHAIADLLTRAFEQEERARVEQS